MVDFSSTPEFMKEKKRTIKKYPSFENEFDVFKKALKVSLPDGLPDTHRIDKLGEKIKIPIYKVKKIRCKSIKKGNNIINMPIITYRNALL